MKEPLLRFGKLPLQEKYVIACTQNKKLHTLNEELIEKISSLELKLNAVNKELDFAVAELSKFKAKVNPPAYNSEYKHEYCCYCEKQIKKHTKNYTMEHLIPVSHGGNNSEINKRPCCKGCNSERGNLSIEDYIAFIANISTGSGKYLNYNVKLSNAKRIKCYIDEMGDKLYTDDKSVIKRNRVKRVIKESIITEAMEKKFSEKMTKKRDRLKNYKKKPLFIVVAFSCNFFSKHQHQIL